jgi:hypothetical protein
MVSQEMKRLVCPPSANHWNDFDRLPILPSFLGRLLVSEFLSYRSMRLSSWIHGQWRLLICISHIDSAAT